MSSDAVQVAEGAPHYCAQADAQDAGLAYEHTEAGSIPRDWLTASCGDLVDPGSPICYGVVQVGADVDGGIPIVAIKFLKDIASAPLHRASLRIEAAYMRSRVRAGDVLVSIKGTIGHVGVVPEGFEGNISRELARLRPRVGLIPAYLAYQLESGATQARISRVVVGTTRLEFSIAALREFQIPVPRAEAEQRAVAEALSDVDGLLGTLEALIAKKRAIKQAAMQQLLTGKTRLPGFSGEWQDRRLADLADFCAGTFLPQVMYKGGAYDVQGAGGLMGRHDIANIPRSLSVIGRVGTIGRPRFYPAGCWVNNNAGAVVARPTADPQFVHLLLLSLDWNSVVSVTAQPFLVVLDLMNTKFVVPDRDEQEAVAAVLSDMDAEIAALEARRDKTRHVKHGMMQQLLTGRVRLVKPEARA